MLELMDQAIPMESEKKRKETGLATGFITRSVENLDPGFYIMDSAEGKFGRVSSGPLHEKVAVACLDQDWLKHAAVHFLLMANFEKGGIAHSGRGYRYVMLEAGRLGQRIYLGATALGMGCCGIGAFYDEEIRRFLALNNESALLYLVAVGPCKT